MLKIDQKEYLKKYLSGTVEKKKKKKKKESSQDKPRVKIIDDDVDVIKRHEEEDDLILTGEDAPQIVGIIDDRPPELKTIEDFRGSEKWKTLSSITKDYNEKSTQEFKSKNELKTYKKSIGDSIKHSNFTREKKDDFRHISLNASESYKTKNTENSLSDDDFSPKRKSRKNSNDDFSPPRKQNKIKVEDDFSPQRKHSKIEVSRKRSRDGSFDYSPPRREGNRFEKITKPRRKSRDSSSDISPPRKSNKSDNLSIRTRNDSSDYSPPRKQRNKMQKGERPGKESRDDSYDRKRKERRNSFDYSPPRKDSNKSISHGEKHKVERTLDGKRAGLQNASALKKETEVFRKKEDEMFRKMPSNISGKNAEIGVRNSRRKTTVEIEREQEKEREKNKREEEKQEIYSRWGIGLKQIENYQNKIADEMHEVNKPLARYSNDADLDEMLKNQEREGDPMLEYIREKNKETKKNSKIPVIPTYKGPFPENRFNIRPGYRWDGVDRSNGYEKKWFDVQNQKKAIQEEAYKYSVEDM